MRVFDVLGFSFLSFGERKRKNFTFWLEFRLVRLSLRILRIRSKGCLGFLGLSLKALSSFLSPSFLSEKRSKRTLPFGWGFMLYAFHCAFFECARKVGWFFWLSSKASVLFFRRKEPKELYTGVGYFFIKKGLDYQVLFLFIVCRSAFLP